MGRTIIDTDGLLDRCHCGARAQFVEISSPRCVFVECSECMEEVAPEHTRGEAMAAWNKKRRKCPSPT